MSYGIPRRLSLRNRTILSFSIYLDDCVETWLIFLMWLNHSVVWRHDVMGGHKPNIGLQGGRANPGKFSRHCMQLQNWILYMSIRWQARALASLAQAGLEQSHPQTSRPLIRYYFTEPSLSHWMSLPAHCFQEKHPEQIQQKIDLLDNIKLSTKHMWEWKTIAKHKTQHKLPPKWQVTSLPHTARYSTV